VHARDFAAQSALKALRQGQFTLEVPHLALAVEHAFKADGDLSRIAVTTQDRNARTADVTACIRVSITQNKSRDL
jgi:hypothetical protein